MASECRPAASQRAHPPPLPAAASGSCTHSHAAGRGAPHVLYAATTADAVILVIRIHLIGHRHGHPAQSGQNVCRAERPCHPQVRGASLEQDLPRGVPARWHRSGRRARAPEPASSSESATRRRTSLKLAFAPRAVQRDLAGWATGLHQGASSPGATRVCGLRTRGHLCPPRSTPRLRPIDRPGTSRSLPIFESGCTRTGRLTGKCRQLDSTFGGKQNAGDLGGPKIDLKTQSKSQFGYRVRACTCSSFLGCTSSTWNQRTFRLRPRYRTTFEHFGSPTPRPWAPTTGVWNVQL